MPTFVAMIAFVTIPGCAARHCIRSATRLHGPCGCPAWSGQRIPTGAKTMQSGQIPRPHSEHETPVSRSGWR